MRPTPVMIPVNMGTFSQGLDRIEDRRSEKPG
jgi:hypothetical protein